MEVSFKVKDLLATKATGHSEASPIWLSGTGSANIDFDVVPKDVWMVTKFDEAKSTLAYHRILYNERRMPSGTIASVTNPIEKPMDREEFMYSSKRENYFGTCGNRMMKYRCVGLCRDPLDPNDLSKATPCQRWNCMGSIFCIAGEDGDYDDRQCHFTNRAMEDDARALIAESNCMNFDEIKRIGATLHAQGIFLHDQGSAESMLAPDVPAYPPPFDDYSNDPRTQAPYGSARVRSQSRKRARAGSPRVPSYSIVGGSAQHRSSRSRRSGSAVS